METRLSNIFKTTNVTNFTKAILKSYKSSISYIQIENTKTTRLLFKGSWILPYFWHSNWHYFGYISGKVAKPHFLESPQKSKRAVEHAIFYFLHSPFFQISNDYRQKSYNGFWVFLGSSNTSQIFLIYTFLTKKRRIF